MLDISKHVLKYHIKDYRPNFLSEIIHMDFSQLRSLYMRIVLWMKLEIR
jgi:hypothetical protein